MSDPSAAGDAAPVRSELPRRPLGSTSLMVTPLCTGGSAIGSMLATGSLIIVLVA